MKNLQIRDILEEHRINYEKVLPHLKRAQMTPLTPATASVLYYMATLGNIGLLARVLEKYLNQHVRIGYSTKYGHWYILFRYDFVYIYHCPFCGLKL